MAPKSPWNKKATTTANAQKNINNVQTVSSTINYGEVQNEEIEVLKAIYMDDYEQVELKGAWSTTTDRSFKLKLRSFSDEESFVILLVRLTSTYPKTIPVLEVQGLEHYHERTQRRVGNIVNNRPKQLLGEVMIHTIANEIQDALEDAVLARQQGTLPSLEDERANAEEVAASLARQVEEAEIRKQQDAKEEEDRMLKQMVDDEIQRREKRKLTKATNEDAAPASSDAESEAVFFDQAAVMKIENESKRFNKVVIVSLLPGGRSEKVFLAKPQLIDSGTPPLVAVKSYTFQKNRDEIVELESNLAAAVKLRHPGLLSLFTYRIEKLSDSRSELLICSEHADRGTLRDLLQLGTLGTKKAKQFTIDVIEALDCLHRNGAAHGRLSPNTIALVGNQGTTPKISEFGYSWILRGDDDVPTLWPAPESGNRSISVLRKLDIWQLGKIVSEIFLGTEVVTKYKSPQLMLASLDLSDSFDDFLRKIFTADTKKRPSAFDLLPSEFLRTDAPAMHTVFSTDLNAARERSMTSSGGNANFTKRRSRHNSSSLFEPMSRYATDFTEIGRLGKGGFGEVVKARNKLDGGVYAVKKIKQAPQLLDQVISEVMLLNRLNHPYVVRYFSAWIEEDTSGAVFDDSTTETETATEPITEDDTSDGPRMDFGYQSKGGLDFVSSSGFPQIEFGDDTDDESSDEDEGREDMGKIAQNGSSANEPDDPNKEGQNGLRKQRSDSRRAPSTLYIQMEYCERHTLRDLIRKTISTDDSWRYVRQITEGLAHIHGHGIIHRDLKPDNIFIDVTGSPKIGDFGLATTAQQHFVERATTMSGYSAGEMTRSVGTTLYVAPELRSATGTSYNDKVDMYSLGIIFYEMCEPFKTGMERIRALQRIREKESELPPAYQAHGEKFAQGKIISCLISHKPSERPSSTELLRSDMLPLKIEDDTIRKAMSSLSDPKSPYHQKMMSALFSHESVNASRIKALAWDARSSGLTEDANRLRLRGIARQNLHDVFRRHGAEEARRESMFPKSGFYTNANLVQLLDASGNLLQLPYDLTLPHARQLARHHSEVRCTYSFGNAYRDAFDGGPPRVSEEVDFDITNGGSGDDDAMNDAEVIKVMDEIVSGMPLFASYTTTSFHLNHANILDAILEFCRIPLVQHPAVKEILSRLGFHQQTWSKVRAELRKFGLPDTALDDLHQFDFRDSPDKACMRIKTLLNSGSSRLQNKLDAGIQHLSEVARSLSQFSLKKKAYVTPLGSVNAKFYEEGLLFQCVLERKSNRVVIAAGGRYDSLIRVHRSIDVRTKPQGAVGVSIGLDPIISNMAKNCDSTSKKTHLKQQAVEEITTKRCNVLVSASGSQGIQNASIKLLTTLWENDISAELANSRNVRHKEYNFIITLRHEASNTVKVLNTETEVEEVDIPMSTLVSYLQQDLRERESSKNRQPTLLRQASQPETERKSNVHVLMARHGSKKSNKYQIVSDAQEYWSRKLDKAKTAPILAVETRDDILDLIQHTKLSDAESWRKAVQSVQLNDRQYMQQIQDTLSSWRKQWEEEEASREACVYNFRTQRCIYYDLGL